MIKYYLAEIDSGNRFKAEQALEAIYRDYGKMILNNANRVLHNVFQAEEILYDVLLIIWEKSSQLKKLKNLLGYILTIAFNRAIDIKRKIKEIPTEFELIDEKKFKPLS